MTVAEQNWSLLENYVVRVQVSSLTITSYPVGSALSFKEQCEKQFQDTCTKFHADTEQRSSKTSLMLGLSFTRRMHLIDIASKSPIAFIYYIMFGQQLSFYFEAKAI